MNTTTKTSPKSILDITSNFIFDATTVKAYETLKRVFVALANGSSHGSVHMTKAVESISRIVLIAETEIVTPTSLSKNHMDLLVELASYARSEPALKDEFISDELPTVLETLSSALETIASANPSAQNLHEVASQIRTYAQKIVSSEQISQRNWIPVITLIVAAFGQIEWNVGLRYDTTMASMVHGSQMGAAATFASLNQSWDEVVLHYGLPGKASLAKVSSALQTLASMESSDRMPTAQVMSIANTIARDLMVAAQELDSYTGEIRFDKALEAKLYAFSGSLRSFAQRNAWAAPFYGLAVAVESFARNIVATNVVTRESVQGFLYGIGSAFLGICQTVSTVNPTRYAQEFSGQATDSRSRELVGAGSGSFSQPTHG